MAGLIRDRLVRKVSQLFAGALLAYAAMIVPALAETLVATTASARTPLEAGQALGVDGHFSLVAPAGWGSADSAFGLSANEKRAWGLTLHGPWRGEIGLRIAVHYYGNGGLQYRSLEHYLNVFAKPALGVALEGSEYGPVADIKLAGRAAKVFERRKNEFVPLGNPIDRADKPEQQDPRVYERREMMARPVPVRERFVVLPAEGGFFALRYTAGQADFEAFLPDFEKVLAGFVPRH